MHELEGSLERKNRSRANIKKVRRKIDSKLKLAQDQVVELDREKKNAETILVQKDRDISALAAKPDIVGMSHRN